MLTEELWAHVKREAEALALAAQHPAAEDSEGRFAFFEGLGGFTYTTAELLMAPELVLFIRADTGKIALAYKYREGDVLFAHADRGGFRGGFSAFAEAATVEDHTDELSSQSSATTEGSEESATTVFHAAAMGLRDLAEGVGATEAVMYIRAAPEAPELGFRVLGDKVDLAAGIGGTFARAHRSFAHSQPVDVSDTVRVAVFVADRAATTEREPRRAFYELTANLVAFNACASARRTFPDMEPSEGRTLLFMRIVRDRCFEGLLMLGVAQALPDDRRVQEWAAEHADPEPDDGLSAVIPQACSDAVSAFVDENGDSEDRDELTEEALDGAYEIISLILRFADEDAMESLAQKVIALVDCWEDPVARPEILELVHAAGIEDRGQSDSLT